MIHLIDKMFAGWAPHDIMWYSWCIMACLILFVWAVVIGVRRKYSNRKSGRTYTVRHASEYDFPMEEDYGGSL